MCSTLTRAAARAEGLAPAQADRHVVTTMAGSHADAASEGAFLMQDVAVGRM
jgi:hypothetical protein